MKKMLSLIATLSLLVACGEKLPDPEPAPAAPTITFSVQELSAGAEGGELSVRVNASAVWSVETDGQDWYSLTTVIDEFVVRDIVPALKKAGAEGIVEYNLNKVIP